MARPNSESIRMKRRRWGCCENSLHCFCHCQNVRGPFDHKIQAGPVLGRRARVHHHGSGARSHFDQLGHLCSGHSQHRVVSDHQVMDLWIEKSEGFLSAVHRVHRIAEIRQKPFRGDPTSIAIIDQEDRFGPRTGCGCHNVKIINANPLGFLFNFRTCEDMKGTSKCAAIGERGSRGSRRDRAATAPGD